MSLQINRSFAAISAGALQSYHTNQTTMGKAITRVSTGKRINTAADDVGAYASSHRLKADSDAYNALYRGVQSGATYLNAADKAMTSIVDMLTAMREKALEYQTTDNTDQKNILENEFKALYDATKTAVDTKVGTNDTLLTDGGTFSFVTGLQAGNGDDVDLSDVPTDVTEFTASMNYTYSNVNKSSIAYYSQAGKNIASSGTLVIADQTYYLGGIVSNNKLADLANKNVGDYYAIFDKNKKIVGAYDSGTGALNWDIRSFKPSSTASIQLTNFSTITDTNITAVSNTGQYSSSTFDVVSFSFDKTNGTGTINIDGVQLTLSASSGTDTYVVTGSINSGTGTNGSLNSQATVADAHVGHYTLDSNGTLSITWDWNAKYLVDGQKATNGVSNTHIVGSSTSYFQSGTTKTYNLMRNFTATNPSGYTIQENTLDYKGDSGSIVVTDNATGDNITYTLGSDNKIYKGTDTDTAYGTWKLDTDGNVSLTWGDPETAKLKFDVKWNGIKDYLTDSEGNDFDITNTDTAKKLADAISKVTEEQSQIGGGINALEYISEHLTSLANVQEEAYTTLTEADMAAEMTAYVKSNIYSQAAQAMIAQANQSLAQVLNLLQ